mgnify:CR=1 FL=1
MSRSSTISATASSPTFLMPESPKTTAPSRTEKRGRPTLMSGGRTFTSMSRQALMYLKTLSVSASSELISEAMNSTGKWALRKAV